MYKKDRFQIRETDWNLNTQWQHPMSLEDRADGCKTIGKFLLACGVILAVMLAIK